MRLLYAIRDPFPTYRPDVLKLFGHTLPALGITSDIVATSRVPVPAEAASWPAGHCLLTQLRGGRLNKLMKLLFADLALLRRARHYDVLVIRDRIFAAWLATLLVRSVPVVYWMSFPFPEEDALRATLPTRNWVFRQGLRLRSRLTQHALYRGVLRRAAHVFVQSERMAEVVREKSRRAERMTPVPMGIDEALLDKCPQPRPLAAFSGRLVIAYLGSLDRVRRIDFLVDVAAALKKHGVSFGLLLIGGTSTPEEMIWLGELIAARGLEREIYLTGQLAPLDAWATLRSASIGLSAIPRGEVFDVSSPTKVVEYLALGIPVVANDIPDQKYLLADSQGGVCAPMEVAAFCDAICCVSDKIADFQRHAREYRTRLIAQRGYRQLGRRVAESLGDVSASFGRQE